MTGDLFGPAQLTIYRQKLTAVNSIGREISKVPSLKGMTHGWRGASLSAAFLPFRQLAMHLINVTTLGYGAGKRRSSAYHVAVAD
jgi:hypothetical protein